MSGAIYTVEKDSKRDRSGKQSKVQLRASGPRAEGAEGLGAEKQQSPS